ncbi:MAG: hypothetical protein HYV26_21865 [Candidatus Hydrogenedentes bacterium]|nr:hypothetical protein [Candidatus Hydrogenedentota bacterium]
MTLLTLFYLHLGVLAAPALQPPAEPLPERAQYQQAVGACLDRLLEFGHDHYGPVHSPLLMSVIDVRTNTAPREPEILDGLIRSEGRLHRRNPGGADLWDDQPLLRVLYECSRQTSDPRYAAAADAHVRAYLQLSHKPNGLLAWGTHIYYEAYKDAPGGDQDGAGPHELLVLCPEWERMWQLEPKLVQQEIEGIWDWHLVDRLTGEHNRHDDRQRGCDFAFSGGEFAYAFAFLYSKTQQPEHLEWAKVVAGRHWNARNPETNLAPDAPAIGDRYDAHHCFTTVSGPHAALLLKCFEATQDPWFRDVAVAYIAAYDKYAWDADAGRYWAMLTLDGHPVPQEPKGEGYDAWKPTGYVDTWRTVMYSYEFPMTAAQTSLYAWELSQDPRCLDAARHWAGHIRQDFPPNEGRRWGSELRQALPALEQTGGTYAENYGRAISFFLRLHVATGEPAALDTARGLAREALAKLSENGWIKGHPAKPYYESTDGVAYFLYALLELAAYPEKLPPNL